ncbi:hypothetical protein ABIA99_002473 [Bradyrhizobium sp. LB12.1]
MLEVEVNPPKPGLCFDYRRLDPLPRVLLP